MAASVISYCWRIKLLKLRLVNTSLKCPCKYGHFYFISNLTLKSQG